jgi:hypothetical protein
MKEFALVYSHSGKFLVMQYADWVEYPIGCIMQTSNDEIELCREANWRNQMEG